MVTNPDIYFDNFLIFPKIANELWGRTTTYKELKAKGPEDDQ
jgi:hypothetical protein